MEATSPMASPDAVHVEGDFDSPNSRHVASNLPFSATCIRIARDSYPNLRSLVSSSAPDDSVSSKIVEGESGYVLEDVPHFTDYLPDMPVSSFISVYFFANVLWNFDFARLLNLNILPRYFQFRRVSNWSVTILSYVCLFWRSFPFGTFLILGPYV